MNSNYDLRYVALGLGIGLIAAYAIDSRPTERAVNKISRVSQSIYNSLTFDNVVMFTGTCIGLAIASKIILPTIKGIGHQLIKS